MENASKALLIAGEVLITILLITLLMYAYSSYQEYQKSQEELAEIEETANFNNQFVNYDRGDVEGYELLSLINQIIDYNERKTEQSVNGSDDKYPYMKITIDMVNQDYRKKLTYNDVNQLFTENKYIEEQLTAIKNYSRVSFQDNILDTIRDIKDSIIGAENETQLTNMAKDIRSIFMTEQDITNEINKNKSNETPERKREIVLMEMANKFNSYISQDKFKIKTIDQAKQLIVNESRGASNQLYNSVCAYYEYMQFKRAIFKCTKLSYDIDTGRVNEFEFEFSGNIH